MKRFVSILLTLVLVLSLGTVTAFADNIERGDWKVSFTSKASMYSNFKTSDIDDTLSGLQPGDSATFVMELSNDYGKSTDWYMTNKVLQSLEASQSVAEGGAYTYILTYTGPDGQDEELYNSGSVGGTDKELEGDKEGLQEATSALEDYFFLDTLATGQRGRITLFVKLDGETQGNDYQRTLARLQMNFAVEMSDDTTTWRPVRTGDETNWLLWAGIMLGCGLAAAAVGVYTLRRNRKNREGMDDE